MCEGAKDLRDLNDLFRRNIAILSRYKPGFLRRYLYSASSIISVINLACSIRVGGALGELKTCRLERIYLTTCLLHSTALAVFEIDMPQLVIEQISWMFDNNRCGAIAVLPLAIYYTHTQFINARRLSRKGNYH